MDRVAWWAAVHGVAKESDLTKKGEETQRQTHRGGDHVKMEVMCLQAKGHLGHQS